MGKRHSLPSNCIIDTKASIVDDLGNKYEHLGTYIHITLYKNIVTDEIVATHICREIYLQKKLTIIRGIINIESCTTRAEYRDNFVKHFLGVEEIEFSFDLVNKIINQRPLDNKFPIKFCNEGRNTIYKEEPLYLTGICLCCKAQLKETYGRKV